MKVAKTDYFKKGMGESEFFVSSCGQGFYGLNAGIVKGQGTQAKHIKRVCVCIFYSPTLVYKARMFLLVLCNCALCHFSIVE